MTKLKIIQYKSLASMERNVKPDIELITVLYFIPLPEFYV